MFRLFLILIALMVCVVPSSHSAITQEIGASLDITRPVAACTFNISLDASYTHASSLGTINRATSLAVDTVNQRAYIGYQLTGGGGLNGAIDRININPLSSSSTSTGIITSAGGNSHPVASVAQNGPASVYADNIMSLAVVGTMTLTGRTLNLVSTGAIFSLVAPVMTDLPPAIPGPGGKFYGAGDRNVIVAPTVEFGAWGSDGTFALGTNAGTTVDSPAVGVSRSGHLLYAHHCTGSGGACNPVADQWTTNPTTFVAGNFAVQSQTAEGLAIDEDAGFWYMLDVTAKVVRKLTLGTGTTVTSLNDNNISASGRDALQISYAQNKIYYTYTNTLGNVALVRVNKSTFASEQIYTGAGAGTVSNISRNVLWIDEVFRKAYVLIDANTASPKVLQFSLCA